MAVVALLRWGLKKSRWKHGQLVVKWIEYSDKSNHCLFGAVVDDDLYFGCLNV